MRSHQQQQQRHHEVNSRERQERRRRTRRGTINARVVPSASLSTSCITMASIIISEQAGSEGANIRTPPHPSSFSTSSRLWIGGQSISVPVSFCKVPSLLSRVYYIVVLFYPLESSIYVFVIFDQLSILYPFRLTIFNNILSFTFLFHNCCLCNVTISSRHSGEHQVCGTGSSAS